MKTQEQIINKLNKAQSYDKVKKFEDYPDFKPDFTPKQMFYLGIFGGSYFSSKHKLEGFATLQSNKFLEDVNSELDKNLFFYFDSHLYRIISDTKVNLFQVDCGSTLEQWQERGWIFEIDPYGWVQWYINFYYGRRDECDAKQIARWKSFKARHSGMLLSKCKPNELTKCLKTRQNLLH
jgi:hypothetical protein